MTETVLITGANRGIGYETAKHFALAGSKVILGVRSQEKGKETIDKLVESGVNSELLDSVVIDLNQPETAEVAAKVLEQSHPDLNLLINNAGIAGDMMRPTTETTAADYADGLAVNFYGTRAVIEAFLPLLTKNQGRITALTGTNSGSIHYCPAEYFVSKCALNALMQSYAVEFENAHRPVEIFGIFPGGVTTDINNNRQGAFMKTAKEAGQQMVTVLHDGKNHNGSIISLKGEVLSDIMR